MLDLILADNFARAATRVFAQWGHWYTHARDVTEDAPKFFRVDRMLSAGNLSFQYLNFLACLTAAGGGPATSADGVMCRFGAEPFFAWEAK